MMKLAAVAVLVRTLLPYVGLRANLPFSPPQVVVAVAAIDKADDAVRAAKHERHLKLQAKMDARKDGAALRGRSLTSGVWWLYGTPDNNACPDDGSCWGCVSVSMRACGLTRHQPGVSGAELWPALLN